MATLRRNGHHLHYDVTGTGEAIIGIHGSPSSAVFWEEAGAELARVGRRILYDRQGYFRSAWEQPRDSVDLDDQVDDAAALLTELDAAPAVVIGRSTGGQIALALALERPDLVRALVLLEPAVFSLDPGAQVWASELRTIVLAAAAVDPSSAPRILIQEMQGAEAWDAFPTEAQEVFTNGAPAMLAEMAGDGLDLSATPFAPTPEGLARVVHPTLVVSGEASYPFGRAVDDALVAALPQARHEVVPGGHLVNPAHPAVLGFVAEVLGQPSAGVGAT